MKKSVKKIVEKTKEFKVKIDSKTIITVRTKEALKYWLTEYPKAQILS
ncbi:MAG: hypothetical protein QNK84_01660 [Flavobacteriales bacterium]|jgi:hypothetical protein|tara:strand:+ start:892 stop:1035 length:144 start_codon:yes stop_codon:yes gene_type:complete